MYFATLHELLLMDGHGGYVWSAYLIVALALGLLVHSASRRRRVVLERVRRRLAARDSNS